MTDKEKLDHLRKIFAHQIKWYHEHIEDDDYLYDKAFDQFNGVDRGDWVEVLIILGHKEEKCELKAKESEGEHEMGQ